MDQKSFGLHVADILREDENVVGLAAGGSWIQDGLDEWSDLDLLLVTRERIAPDAENMKAVARKFGHLLASFTGEHVREPRLLICLYDQPLLHVDIKFLDLEELENRVEDPVILLDKDGRLQAVLDRTRPVFPHPDFQWIEDRFWIWVHYTLAKIARGEYLEAIDSLGYMRQVVWGPLLHLQNGQLPRGVRRGEFLYARQDLAEMYGTLSSPRREALLAAVDAGVALYRRLREHLFPASIQRRREAEQRVMQYFETLRPSGHPGFPGESTLAG